MAEHLLNVEVRTATGKGVARKLRAAGRIPGVCYAPNETQPVSLDPIALDRLIRSSASGMNTLIDLKVSGGSSGFDGKKVLLREMQRDPVSNAALHADFFAVDMTHTIEVSVPVHVTGTAVGVTLGGILDHALREIHVECLPHSIPEAINIDVSGLEVGDSLHVRDLVLPAGVTLRSDLDLSVVSVVAPKAIEEEVPAEAAEGAAPTEVAEGTAEGAKPADSED